MPVQDRLHAREIAGRREQHAAGAHDGLGDERADRIWPLSFNDRLDLAMRRSQYANSSSPSCAKR